MTMYRARVEAVSGLHVRAGGKWLTCIGNRTVKAGDLVWTDGRCVYGHDQESQSPLVIAPPKEDLAVPIQIGYPPETLFTFRKNELVPVSSSEYVGRLLNDTKGHVYYLNAAAANIDKAGDLYILDGSNAEYRYTMENDLSPSGGLLTDCDNPNPSFAIKKNGHVVAEISLEDVIENTASVAKSYSLGHASALPKDYIGGTQGDAFFWLYYEHRSARLLYSFIENENSWAVIYKVDAEYMCAHYWWTWGEGGYPGSPFRPNVTAEYRIRGFYYIDSADKKKLLCQTEYGSDLQPTGNPFYYVEKLPNHIQAVIDTESINIPIQDGYFFKINYNFVPELLADSLPGTLGIKYNFYSPKGKFLCSLEKSDLSAFQTEAIADWTFTIQRLAEARARFYRRK